MKLNVDVKEEALDIAKKLNELADYLKDPEDKNNNQSNNNNQKGNSGGSGKNSNNSNDSGNNQNNQQSGGSNSNNTNNNQNDKNTNKDNKQNNSQSGQSNSNDPKKQLQDEINKLNNLLNQKDPNKQNQNVDPNDSTNGSGEGQTGQSGGSSSNGSGGSGTGSSNGNGESKSTKLTYHGKEIDIKDYHQDIKTNKGDEDKTDKEVEGTINRILQQVEDEMNRSYSSSGSGAYLRKIYQDSIKPEPPKWVNILNPYLRPDNNVDWKWQKAHSNKITRMSGGKILFRGMERPKTQLKGLCIALDNSGSIGLKDFEKFYSTCFGFLKVRPHVKGIVCWWDTEVKSKEDLGWGEFKDLPSFEKIVHGPKPGGGGTDPRAALDFAREHDCPYIIIFTDGEFAKVDKKYEKDFKKVIWCLCNETQYDAFDEPFGTKCL